MSFITSSSRPFLSAFLRTTPPPRLRPCCIAASPRAFPLSTMSAPQRRLQNPAIFVCDLQEKFKNAIHQFDKIVLTSQKVLRAAQILKVPVYVTTQNAARLGGTVPEIQSLVGDAVVSTDKTCFSMMVPDVAQHFPPSSAISATSTTPPSEVVIVGIESHICVTQTAMDLLKRGHRVYVLADGVSSCNEQEVPLALARLRAEGAVVTTSESWIFECMGDAAIGEFKEMARLVKETGPDTKAALSGLLSKI